MSALDEILSELSGELRARLLHTSVGQLSPEQLLHKATWLLKHGGEAEPLARQVAALCILALEKLRLS